MKTREYEKPIKVKTLYSPARPKTFPRCCMNITFCINNQIKHTMEGLKKLRSLIEQWSELYKSWQQAITALSDLLNAYNANIEAIN